jgi:hypothetical protein
VRRLLVTASVFPSSPNLVTLMKEAICFSETSAFTRATRRNIPGDAILHSHRRENLKSYISNLLCKIDVVIRGPQNEPRYESPCETHLPPSLPLPRFATQSPISSHLSTPSTRDVACPTGLGSSTGRSSMEACGNIETRTTKTVFKVWTFSA